MIELMILPIVMLVYLMTWAQAEAATTKSRAVPQSPPPEPDYGQARIEEARKRWLVVAHWWNMG